MFSLHVVIGPYSLCSYRVYLIFYESDVQSEREKFFNDAKRLAEDVSKNQTFYTVQPLLNFWAAFTPSDEVNCRSCAHEESGADLDFRCMNPEWNRDARCAQGVSIFLTFVICFEYVTNSFSRSTPFELYRDGTELRGVYYGKPEVARAACDALGDRCNYPILLGMFFTVSAVNDMHILTRCDFVLYVGNDPLYGGTLNVI